MTATLDHRQGPATPPKRPKQPRLPKDRRGGRGWLRKLLIISSFLLFSIITIIGGAIALAWNSLQLPTNEVPLAQTSFITDANGKRLAELNAGENRVPVKIGEVPQVVTQAVLDTEDHNYFNHRGVDPRGTARALYSDLFSKHGLQGGSTITQQYVKTVYVGSKRTPIRKFKEAILALKLERKYTKNEILERYLNVIYFGRGTYGVQTASKAYFGKDVKQLGTQEAAYLAGLIRAPELADAYAQPETAKQRRDLTLGSMVRYGHLSSEEEARISKIPLGGIGGYVIPRAPANASTAMTDKGTQYFVDYVKSTLIKRYGEQKVETGGLRVKTTLDLDAQAQAYDSVYGFLKPGEPAGALVSLDQNGQIKAMVGGRDYSQSQVNLALGVKENAGSQGRAAGSTFKPFMLAASLQDGLSVRETFSGASPMKVKGWDATGSSVTNFGNEQFGNIDLEEATVESVNTVYAQLVVQEGVDKLINTAKAAGITSPLQPVNSLVLGVDDVSPLEMADAYLTFAQRGMHVTPNPILEVKDSSGKTFETFKAERKRVMSEDTADVVNTVLQQVVQRGTGKTALGVGKPIAGKTGTTEDNGDAWFVGYRPNLATAVWMGYPEGNTHKMSNVRGIAVTGGTFPTQMFTTYMKWAAKGDDNATFADPKNFDAGRRRTPPTTVPLPTTTTEADLETTTTVDRSTTTTGKGLKDLNGNGNGNGRGNRPSTTVPVTVRAQEDPVPSTIVPATGPPTTPPVTSPTG